MYGVETKAVGVTRRDFARITRNKRYGRERWGLKDRLTIRFDVSVDNELANEIDSTRTREN